MGIVKRFFSALGRKIMDHLPAMLVTTLLTLLVVVYFFNSIFVSIPPGHAGVLWLRLFNGTVVDKVYGEGVHVIFPWDKMFIYNVRMQEVTRDFDALSRNGLKVGITVSIRFYPEYVLLGAMHQRIGPDFVDTVIVPTVESVLREVVGRLDDEEIYTTNAVLAKSVTEAVEQVARRFLNIDAVLITKVTLPESVQKVIQYKVEQMHRLQAYKFLLDIEKEESERRRIEAEGIARANNTIKASLTPEILKYKGVIATQNLANSNNSKVIVIGNGDKGLPVILGGDK